MVEAQKCSTACDTVCRGLPVMDVEKSVVPSSSPGGRICFPAVQCLRSCQTRHAEELYGVASKYWCDVLSMRTNPVCRHDCFSVNRTFPMSCRENDRFDGGLSQLDRPN